MWSGTRPSGPRTPTSRAPGAISTSGRCGAAIHSASAPAIPISPASRHGPRHRNSHSPPSVISGRTAAGPTGTGCTAPGCAAIPCAAVSTHSIPSPISHSGGPASPTGASTPAATAEGAITSPITGTAAKFAGNP